MVGAATSPLLLAMLAAMGQGSACLRLSTRSMKRSTGIAKNIDAVFFGLEETLASKSFGPLLEAKTKGWCEDGQAHPVRDLLSKEQVVDAFGGESRVAMLEKFLSELQSLQIQVHGFSWNKQSVIADALAMVGLDQHFDTIFGQDYTCMTHHRHRHRHDRVDAKLKPGPIQQKYMYMRSIIQSKFPENRVLLVDDSSEHCSLLQENTLMDVYQSPKGGLKELDLDRLGSLMFSSTHSHNHEPNPPLRFCPRVRACDEMLAENIQQAGLSATSRVVVWENRHIDDVYACYAKADEYFLPSPLRGSTNNHLVLSLESMKQLEEATIPGQPAVAYISYPQWTEHLKDAIVRSGVTEGGASGPDVHILLKLENFGGNTALCTDVEIPGVPAATLMCKSDLWTIFNAWPFLKKELGDRLKGIVVATTFDNANPVTQHQFDALGLSGYLLSLMDASYSGGQAKAGSEAVTRVFPQLKTFTAVAVASLFAKGQLDNIDGQIGIGHVVANNRRYVGVDPEMIGKEMALFMTEHKVAENLSIGPLRQALRATYPPSLWHRSPYSCQRSTTIIGSNQWIDRQ